MTMRGLIFIFAAASIDAHSFRGTGPRVDRDAVLQRSRTGPRGLKTLYAELVELRSSVGSIEDAQNSTNTKVEATVQNEFSNFNFARHGGMKGSMGMGGNEGMSGMMGMIGGMVDSNGIDEGGDDDDDDGGGIPVVPQPSPFPTSSTTSRLTPSPTSLPPPSPAPTSPIVTSVPTPPVTSPPTLPPAEACSVCGIGLQVTLPGAIFQFPGQPAVPCGTLEAAGVSGLISAADCSVLPSLIGAVCGCGFVPTPQPTPQPTPPPSPSPQPTPQPTPPPSPSPQPTPQPTPPPSPSPQPTPQPTPPPTNPVPVQIAPVGVGTPPPSPQPTVNMDIGCSICGDNMQVTLPDIIFAFPGQPAVPCGTLEAAGQAGLINQSDCSFLPSLLGDVCGCAPLDDACSICGDGMQVTLPNAVFAFPGQPDTTCGTLENEGQMGVFGPADCAALPSLLTSLCGCAPMVARIQEIPPALADVISSMASAMNPEADVMDLLAPAMNPAAPAMNPAAPAMNPAAPATSPAASPEAPAAPITFSDAPATFTLAPIALSEVSVAPVAPTATPVALAEALVTVSASPIALSEAPVALSEAPAAPTDPPVALTAVPVAPTEVPVAPTDVPVAPTAVPVSPTEVPVATTEFPVARSETRSVALEGDDLLPEKHNLANFTLTYYDPYHVDPFLLKMVTVEYLKEAFIFAKEPGFVGIEVMDAVETPGAAIETVVLSCGGAFAMYQGRVPMSRAIRLQMEALHNLHAFQAYLDVAFTPDVPKLIHVAFE